MKKRKRIRAALIQTHSITGKFASKYNLKDIIEIRERNLVHNVKIIDAAVSQGVELICLNELFALPYFPVLKSFDPVWFEIAENIPQGYCTQSLKKVSEEKKIVIIAPIYERDRENGNYYSAAVVLDNGRILGKCRKTNVPFGSNEKGVFSESFYYKPSDDPEQNGENENMTITFSPYLPVFDTSVCEVGVNICYGRHFAKNWEVLRKNGAELVFCPSVTFGDVSERIWKHEFPTLAVWNSIYIGASNKKGKDFLTSQIPTFFGKSYFVGPDGKQLENIAKGDLRKLLVISDINLGLVGINPSGWTLEADNRTDI